MACGDPTDCPDAATQVCDSATATCTEDTCTDHAQCDGGVCVLQTDGVEVGECYSGCTPNVGGSCPFGTTCLQFGLDHTSGYCVAQGTAGLGQTCTPVVVNTGCEAGMRCLTPDATSAGFCTALCSVFEVDPGCGAGLVCWPGGFCTDDVGSLEPALYGETCAADPGTLCGNDGQRVGGACGVDGVCRPICRLDKGDADCAAGELCEDAFGAVVGLCQGGG
jgi:hypothetical protein